MAHYAKMNDDVVEEVVVVNSVSVDEDNETEVNAYLAACGMPGTWLKCSYNTRNGSHLLGGVPFRGTYPGIGMFYDSALDIFVPERRPAPETKFDFEAYRWLGEQT
jgi:hypothetical protein